MKRKRYSEEQIIGILREAEAGVPVADLCRKHGISDEECPHSARERLVLVFQDCWQRSGQTNTAGSNSNAVLQQKGSDLADSACSSSDKTLANARQYLQIVLLGWAIANCTIR